jgi:hypothetical protein
MIPASKSKPLFWSYPGLCTTRPLAEWLELQLCLRESAFAPNARRPEWRDKHRQAGQYGCGFFVYLQHRRSVDHVGRPEATLSLR